MAEYEKNAGKIWTPEEIKKLREMAWQNTPTRVIALKLKRPVGGVATKASEKNISLRPTNQSPYNRRKRR